jgi:hypothetical protein
MAEARRKKTRHVAKRLSGHQEGPTLLRRIVGVALSLLMCAVL